MPDGALTALFCVCQRCCKLGFPLTIQSCNVVYLKRIRGFEAGATEISLLDDVSVELRASRRQN